MKPRILLSLNTKKENYINAVNNCGGIAIPQYCPDISGEYDGLILCGGNDIDPKYYNEKICGSVNIDSNRDECEFELVKLFTKQKKPIMGICRGCQLLNVAFGGTLYQDIPNANEHCSFSDYDILHKTTARKDCFLYDMYGPQFYINSFHHQAIKTLGKDFDIISTAFDGVTVEGILHNKLPVFGVQWHPERLCFEHKKENTADGAELFKYFISLCNRG